GTISSAPAQPLHDNPFKPGRRPARSGCRPVFSPDPLNGTEAKDDFTFSRIRPSPPAAAFFNLSLVAGMMRFFRRAVPCLFWTKPHTTVYNVHSNVCHPAIRTTIYFILSCLCRKGKNRSDEEYSDTGGHVTL